MRRLVFLGMAAFGLATGTAACGDSPVQPGAPTKAVELTPSSGKKPSAPQTVSAPMCESLIYPTSLCMPTYRTEVCAALRYGSANTQTFTHPVVGRSATQTFARVDGGSVETVEIFRPYGFPPTILTFRIRDSQIEGVGGMCYNVVTTPPTA
ncbi:MAG: hypothetical protein ABR499_15085 [Gemmatimonadaceae bacterium]